MCAAHRDTLHESVPDRVQGELAEECCDGHKYCEKIMCLPGDHISSEDVTAQLGGSNAPSAEGFCAEEGFCAKKGFCANMIAAEDVTAQLGGSNAPSASVLAAAGFFAAVGLVVVGLTVQRRWHRWTQQADRGVASDHVYDHPGEVESGAAGGHEDEDGDDSAADYDAVADEGKEVLRGSA